MGKRQEMCCGSGWHPGLIPGMGSIMENGNRAQESNNVIMNQNSYYMYLWRLMDLGMSVFTWKNLPEGIDERMLEYWLLMNGLCVFFYDEDLKSSTLADNNAPDGYAVLQCMIAGQWDMYNYPKERMAYAVNGLNVQLNEKNSVIIFNDYLRVPMVPTIQLYAQRLAEIDRTIDVNVMNQKSPKVIRCKDKQRLTMKNLAMQVDGNVYWVFADKNLDLDDIEILDLTAPYVANELQVLKKQYWSEACSFLGIESSPSEKRERLVSGEASSAMANIEAQRFTRLNARKQACEKINKLFGLEVDVEFRSGVYIQATDDDMDEIKLLLDADERSESDAAIEPTLLDRIRKVLNL